jgi:hypothetical protein
VITMVEKIEQGTKTASGVPRTTQENVPVVKIRFSREKLIEVIERAKKRGFPALCPEENGGRLSTAGLVDYYRELEARSDVYDRLRQNKAQEAVKLIEGFGLTDKDLLEAKLKK